jgi:putative membrane protein
MNMIKTAAAAACIALCASAAYAVEPMQPSGAIEAVLSNSDKAFFENAASAGKFEIEAGKLAQTKASDPQVKSYAEKMISDHTEAADKLEKLAAAKKVTLPTALSKHHQMMLDRLNKDSAGADFDAAYKRQMIASHKEAVSLFDQESKKGQDADVKAFAAETLPKLQMHGGMAHELLPKKKT